MDYANEAFLSLPAIPVVSLIKAGRTVVEHPLRDYGRLLRVQSEALRQSSRHLRQQAAAVLIRARQVVLGTGDGAGTLAAGPQTVTPSAPAEATGLFERLDHLLSLAERFPRGAPADRLRRSVYESIEAVSLTDRRKHLARVLHEIERLKRHHIAGGHSSGAGSAISVEALLIALHAAVISVLAPEPR